MAIKFDFDNNSTGLSVNGANFNKSSADLSGINLRNSHVFNVAMTYDGKTLKVTITDATTRASATQSYLLDIVGTVGGSAAWVGFSAGAGSSTATQSIQSWTYTPGA